jgi:hypothetical protein
MRGFLLASRQSVDTKKCAPRKVDEPFHPDFLRVTTVGSSSAKDAVADARRWQEVKTILADALQLGDSAAREAFVAAASGGDAAIQAEVTQLLASGDAAWCDDEFLCTVRAVLLRALGVGSEDAATIRS